MLSFNKRRWLCYCSGHRTWTRQAGSPVPASVARGRVFFLCWSAGYGFLCWSAGYGFNVFWRL